MRPLFERSMDSTGSVPFSFIISRGWPSKLQTGVQWMRQRLLTWRAGERGEAYLTLVSVWLMASASATCLAPSGPSSLKPMLQTSQMDAATGMSRMDASKAADSCQIRKLVAGGRTRATSSPCSPSNLRRGTWRLLRRGCGLGGCRRESNGHGQRNEQKASTDKDDKG